MMNDNIEMLSLHVSLSVETVTVRASFHASRPRQENKKPNNRKHVFRQQIKNISETWRAAPCLSHTKQAQVIDRASGLQDPNHTSADAPEQAQTVEHKV